MTSDAGGQAPTGLAYSRETDMFFIVQPVQPDSLQADQDLGGHLDRKLYTGSNRKPNQSVVNGYEAAVISQLGVRVGSVRIDTNSSDPVNTLFDVVDKRLLLLSTVGYQVELVSIPIAPSGPHDGPERFDLGRFGLENPRGMTIDPANGDLYILDAAVPRIVGIQRRTGRGFAEAAMFELDLAYAGLGELQGIAFDPGSGRLQVLNPGQQQLHEITVDGQLVTSRDLSEIDLGTPQGMVFAPSGDQTDDPNEMSLYIANSGKSSSGSSGVTEISLISAPPPALDPTIYAELVDIAYAGPAFLANIVDTFAFNPPSPDPSGIGYLPQSGTLLISDGEVNEIPSLFTGDNLFQMTLGGTLIATSTTIDSAPAGFSAEPNGLSGANPLNNHIFITDDQDDEVSEVDPGPDGSYGTADDIVTEFSTRDFSPASNDPEGVAFAPALGELFVADGVNDEIYRIAPGNNGIFDGPPAGGGDDVVTHFDTQSSGLTDPEGIEYDQNDGTLLVIGRPTNRMFQFSVTGALLSTIDISAATTAGLDAPAGLAIAPSSQAPNEVSVYIVDRAVDNGANPNENDGRVFEVTGTQQPQVNQVPLVDSGPNQTIALPGGANLNGTVIDDGLPNPPATVTTSWTRVSGPGTVTFGNAAVVDTTASFSTNGVYVLRLTADDSLLTAFNDVTITVLPEGSASNTIDIRVSASNDDAEETFSGSMQLSSTDLDFGGKFVGMRFRSTGIPSQATIVNAHIQFQADKTNSSTTSFVINGHAHDDAPLFTSSNGNISSRALTAASVGWAPPAWTAAGQASAAQRTPDISAIVQEMVNRPGWSSASSLVIIVDDGPGARAADSFNGSSSGAPLLHVEYVTGTGGNLPPAVAAGPNQTITLPGGAALDGTVSDDGLPNPPANVTTMWIEVSGPGTVTFGNASAVDTTANFSTNGTYVLRLTADDDQLTALDELTVTVNPPAPGNQSPTVSAGADQTISLPGNANLDGTISDDGLPNPPAGVTTAWSEVSGPGTVTFGNASAIDTTASFSVEGTYVLRLTADDSELTSFDELTVTALPEGSASTTVEIRVVANSDDVEETSSGTMQLGSGDLDIGRRHVGVRFVSPGIPQQAVIVNAYIQFQADGSDSSTASFIIQGHAHDNAPTFASNNGNMTSRERTAASVQWAPPAWATGQVGLAQRTADLSAIVQELVNRPGWTNSSSVVLIINDGSGEREAEPINGNQPAGAPLLHVEYVSSGGGNQAPNVSAGPDQNIVWPANANLNGTVTDDGLPSPPAAVTTSWSRISGPGTVTFGDAGAVDTNASFSVEGTYVIRLTADDGELTTFDELTVSINAPGSTTTVEVRVAASTDDAEESYTTAMQLTSTDLDIGARNKPVGMRFISPGIPQQATIVNAYVQFQADETNTTTASFIIQGEAIDDAPTFTSTNSNITTRALTAASVLWAPPAWTAVGEVAAAQRTSDLSGIVQEVVNRPGWTSGSSLVLIITDSDGLREAISFNGNQAGAPLLHIEYQ